MDLMDFGLKGQLLLENETFSLAQRGLRSDPHCFFRDFGARDQVALLGDPMNFSLKDCVTRVVFSLRTPFPP